MNQQEDLLDLITALVKLNLFLAHLGILVSEKSGSKVGQ